MKRIKRLLMPFLMLMLCTGCSVEYNLNITPNSIEEIIEVTDYISTNRTKDDILNKYNKWYPTFVNFIKNNESIEPKNFNTKIEGVEYHTKDIKELNNGYKYTYTYIYDIDEYYDSYLLANTFYKTTVKNNRNSLVLKTSNESFFCDYDYFDDIKIKITIDQDYYKLNYTNGKKINNNTYIWQINKNDCQNSEIILTLDINQDYEKIENEKSSEQQEEKKNTNINNYTLYIFLVILMFILYLGYKWFEIFKEKNNKIDDD